MQRYHYFAFISYQHKDEKWAKWLQRKLEGYKLPASADTSQDKVEAKYIRPVFRDKTDITPGPLTQVLKNALEKSQYLIVICSPNAAKSSYVNDEIAYFIEQGKVDNIIPFIIKGTPNSDNECFPENLKQLPKSKEINGANIQTQGKQQAFIATVARMLNLQFNVLWDRYKQDEKRKKIGIISIATILLLIASCLFEYYRPSTKFYADFVGNNGIPQGVCELSSSQVSHRNRNFKFTYKRIPIGEPNALSWRVQKVECVNSKGNTVDPATDEDRVAIMKFEYFKQSGMVSQAQFCNRNGITLYRYNYTSPNPQMTSSVIDVKKPIEERGEGFVASNTILSYTNQERFANINRYVLKRINGHIIQISYHYGNSYEYDETITADENGISGKQFQLDALGRCVVETYLDKNGNERCDKQGICKVKYKYDQFSNKVEVSFWNQHNNLRACRNGWAIKRTETDEYGNTLRVSLYDAKNNPCLEKEFKYSSYTQAFDEHGNIVAQDYFDNGMNPTNISEGYSKVKCEYDKRGYLKSISYYDAYDHLINNRNGYAKANIVCDNLGNYLEIEYQNDSLKICKNKDGVAIMKQVFQDGNLIEQAYFDVDGKPCMNRFDYAKLVNKFDENGNRIQGCYLDTLFKPHVSNYYNYAILKNEYDIRGNWTSKSYFDSNNNPVMDRGGNYSKLEMNYNKYGLLKEEVFIGVDGKPRLGKEGYCRRIFEYNEYGLRTKETSLDLNDNPTICVFCKNAIKTYKYDSNLNLVEEAYYNENNKPCMWQNRYFRIVYTYDDWGNCESSTKYNESNVKIESDDIIELLNSLLS